MRRRRPVCEICGALNPRKAFRLDPRNLRPSYLLACLPCMRKLRYTPVSHDRPYVGMNAQHLL